MTETYDTDVLYLATQGDGAVLTPDGNKAYIPQTLAGERVRLTKNADGKWQLAQVLQPSPNRQTPPCTLFERCGGCTLQHIKPATILQWKKATVQHALQKAGFTNLPACSAQQVQQHTRRRADLAVRRQPDGIIIGLHARNSSTVTDLTSCIVLHPDIMKALSAFRATLRSLNAIRREANLHINLLDSGLDVLLQTDGPLTAPDRVRLAQLATDQHIPRISWQLIKDTGLPEVAAQSGSVYQTIASHQITPPPGTFLQATGESEIYIQEAVIKSLPAKLNRRDIITELYAGCGTFTFPLAERARVNAYEGYAPALDALKKASGGTRINAFCRDLNHQPVLAKEIAASAVVVLDPPHAGAKLQMRQIAQGQPTHIIYVSCNPAALAQDASLLAKAGYTVENVTVVDQFLWSTEIEAVCSFKRESSRRNRNGLSR
ncbi:23S rRNA methyltransferase [Acetobacter pomorum]|uniref:23S rRNA methyltransferase n=1 Tax=Acetobacter pomorum TaxID=65959 RepID=A0A2G4RC52_9PROT|nr:class I SAM-dependent RNA methyltransferase [Acetobacter pomorum]PHY94144.1 23S rRNA methyltransferase [Acetobacter pomorum]